MASPVLVTGGTGRLGKLVVARLLDSGCDVRVLARHEQPTPRGVTFFPADLRAGRGIEPAVTAAAAIIHCATSTRGDAEATRNLVAAASRAFPVAPVPAGFTVQPVDPRDVADRLAELALGEPTGRAPDLAGPQVSTWTDLLRGYLQASRCRRWVLPVRIPGTRAVRNGALLPPPGHTTGSRTWDQFLTAQLRQQAAATA